jgi:hypothetical protein
MRLPKEMRNDTAADWPAEPGSVLLGMDGLPTDPVAARGLVSKPACFGQQALSCANSPRRKSRCLFRSWR